MKKTVLAVLALAVLAASHARGADLIQPTPIYKAPPPSRMPVYTWTGCYIGGNVGWGRIDTRATFFGLRESVTSDGFVGGGQIGCDYQFATSWVIGIEGLIDAAGIEGSHDSTIIDPGDTYHSRTRWFGTIAGRLGFNIAPSFLFYGKGGWGFVDQRLTVTNTTTGVLIATGENKKFNGPEAGAGFEWMLAPNWSLWAEWDHIFGRDEPVVFVTPGGVPIGTPSIRRDFDKVLAGINWRFGGGPVPAAY